jgi:hypothetical protein
MLARERAERPESMREVIAKLGALEGQADKRTPRRWLGAAAMMLVLAAAIGVAASSARVPSLKSVESNLAGRIPEASPESATAPPGVRAPEPKEPRLALGPEPARVPAERGPTKTKGAREPAPNTEPEPSRPERLPGGVLKASPY